VTPTSWRPCTAHLCVCAVPPSTACPPGQGRTLGNNEPCQPCPRNFYNPGGLQADCLPCPYGLVTTSEGAACCGEGPVCVWLGCLAQEHKLNESRCGRVLVIALAALTSMCHAGCPPGFGANPDRSARARKCVKCPPGTYYPGGNVEPCWRCRGSAYLTTQPGAASIVQCVCRPGCVRWAQVSSRLLPACRVCKAAPSWLTVTSLRRSLPHSPTPRRAPRPQHHQVWRDAGRAQLVSAVPQGHLFKRAGRGHAAGAAGRPGALPARHGQRQGQGRLLHVQPHVEDVHFMLRGRRHAARVQPDDGHAGVNII
jgi:hypothetical protein